MIPVEFLRSRIAGPELALEDAIVEGAVTLTGPMDANWVTLGSVRVGAGFPDLTFCALSHQVSDFPCDAPYAPTLLGYLRTVSRASPITVAKRTGLTSSVVQATVNALLASGALLENGNSLSIQPKWRTLLPEVIAVEVKISNWRDCVAQAIRNVVFATRSYIALPEAVAARAVCEPLLGQFGVGVLSVSSAGSVRILRRTRRQPPRVWKYYYELAKVLAEAQSRRTSGLPSAHRGG